MSVSDELRALLLPRLTPEGAAWLVQAIGGLAGGSANLKLLFPAVSRQLGRAPLGPLALGDLSLGAWRTDDAGRALLLLASGGGLAAARDLYFSGDARERVGALRALPLLGTSDDALPALLDAVRVNQGEIFEAAIADNPYTSRHLPALEFRKAALKCVFVGLSLTRIVGLKDHTDAELCHSLLDYVHEREAASRSVPPELWPIMAAVPPPGLAAKLLGYLEHPFDEHRAAAATALGLLLAAGDERVRSFLADRAARETVPHVQHALKGSL